MQGRHNIHILSFIIFISLQNYLIFDYYLIPLMFKQYAQMAVWFFPAVMAIAAVLIFLLPRKINAKYFDILKNSLIARYIFIVIQGLLMLLLLWASFRLIIIDFFYNMPWFFFALALVATIIYLARNTVNVLVNAATFPFIIGMLAICGPFLLSHNIRDYTYLLPLINPGGSFAFLLLLLLVLDSISLCFISNMTQTTLKNWHLFIGVMITLLLSMAEQINVLLICGLNYITDTELIGFLALYIQDIVTYIGNLRYIYVYLVPLLCTFKCGMSLRFIKELVGLKDRKYKDIIIGILMMGVLVFMNYQVDFMKSILHPLLIVTTAGLAIIYALLLINRSEKYEATF